MMIDSGHTVKIVFDGIMLLTSTCLIESCFMKYLFIIYLRFLFKITSTFCLCKTQLHYFENPHQN